MNKANELNIMIDSSVVTDRKILELCQAAEDIDIDVRDETHYGRAWERDAPKKQLAEEVARAKKDKLTEKLTPKQVEIVEEK